MKIHTASPLDTEILAQTLSLFARPGFVILLRGDLGAGKSTFARAFIKALAIGNTDFDVPSPTFSLIQAYDNTRVPVAHVDLYRLQDSQEAQELGLNELAKSNLLLIEWPSAAQEKISPDTLQLNFSGQGEQRDIAVKAQGAWVQVLARNAEIEKFLKSANADLTTRRYFDGDASSRRYEKVKVKTRELILMDMPHRPDGPAVKDGKPYSAIAHLAEGIASVTAINDHLVAQGYGAPEIYDCDSIKGFGLIENLGDKVFGVKMRAGENMDVPLRAAVSVLADMANRSWPHEVKNRDGKNYVMPHYDEAAQLIEIDLLPAWFHVHIHGKPAPQSLHESFAEVWHEVLPLTHPKNPVWVLRDFHSPNLIWCPERKGHQQIGLIDTQDALLGHPAYDLVSMLQDARIDFAFEKADELYAHYVKLRYAAGPFDEKEFAAAYAILGAQRATKILGIFVRLNLRDGKPQYLQHLPRLSRYLMRNLDHPVLAKLKHWYEAHLPAALSLSKA